MTQRRPSVADSGQYYARPKEAFRFRFDGVKTNSVADSLPPGKYPYAQNIRSLGGSSVQTRSGIVKLFPASTTNAIRAYTALNTDSLPRILAAGPAGGSTHVYLGQPGDTSTLVGTLSGGSVQGVSGVSMI